VSGQSWFIWSLPIQSALSVLLPQSLMRYAFYPVIFLPAVLSLFLLFNVHGEGDSLLSGLGHVTISLSSADILRHVPDENGAFSSGSHNVVLVRGDGNLTKITS